MAVIETLVNFIDNRRVCDKILKQYNTGGITLVSEDRKTKKIEINITHKEIDMDGGCSILGYGVEMRIGSSTWNECASSKEHLEAIVRGINMTLGMMGVHGGIPHKISTPFATEITCYQMDVCYGFE